MLAIVLVGASLSILYLAPRLDAWETITVGHVPMESFAVLYVAESQQFFKQHNLNVSIEDYATGATAVDALVNGDVDVAGSSEYVVALNAVEQQNISIVTACADSELIVLIARTDRGITNASDLSGQKIGVAQKTVAEFYLGQFLQTNDLDMQDVTIVNVVPAQFVDAIVNGSVDAVVTWEPYTDQAISMLQTGIVSWSLNADTPPYSVLSCRNDWITTHTSAINRFTKSLAQAQEYIESHPTEAQQIIKNRFNYTDSYISTVWDRNNFNLSLTQTLLKSMQDESTWLINNNLTTQKTAPTITNYVNTSALKAIKPEAVTIP